MNVLLVEPEKTAYEAEIGDSLKAMQNAVGGYIEVIYPFDDPVALVCNEEGKNLGLPPNRALRDENGKIYDIVVGTFFVCGLSENEFNYSLSPELMEKYKAMFEVPQMFVRVNGEIQQIPMAPEYFEEG